MFDLGQSVFTAGLALSTASAWRMLSAVAFRAMDPTPPAPPPPLASQPSVSVPRCAECGYDLSGIIAGGAGVTFRCPECGVAFDPASLRVLPDLPGFWRLTWVCLRPAAAYLGLVMLLGTLIARKGTTWGVVLACAGPPLLLSLTLMTVVVFAGDHYVAKDRWWVVFLMLLSGLAASTVVSLVCSLGLATL